MTIQEMHYDFKRKFNKIDSQNNRNLQIPEIDQLLNEAQEVFIKMVAFPRLQTALGFEKTQRSTDDIRTIVVPNTALTFADPNATLPDNYWHFLKGTCTISKNVCPDNKTARLVQRQHDDDFEKSPFDKSSYEWRIVNGVFDANGIQVFTDGTFSISAVTITYLRRPLFMHYADGFSGNQYTLPGSTVLTGTQDCELPEQTHREIVDLAVMLALGDLTSYDVNAALTKLRLNQLVN